MPAVGSPPAFSQPTPFQCQHLYFMSFLPLSFLSLLESLGTHGYTWCHCPTAISIETEMRSVVSGISETAAIEIVDGVDYAKRTDGEERTATKRKDHWTTVWRTGSTIPLCSSILLTTSLSSMNGGGENRGFELPSGTPNRSPIIDWNLRHLCCWLGRVLMWRRGMKEWVVDPEQLKAITCGSGWSAALLKMAFLQHPLKT